MLEISHMINAFLFPFCSRIALMRAYEFTVNVSLCWNMPIILMYDLMNAHPAMYNVFFSSGAFLFVWLDLLGFVFNRKVW